jgi:S1-C subfamily serine protease
MRTFHTILILALVTSACIACRTPAPTAPRAARAVDATYANTVRITNLCGGMGSGVVVSKYHVITAAHVVEGSAGCELPLVVEVGLGAEKPTAYLMTIDVLDEESDLARLIIVGLGAFDTIAPIIAPPPVLGGEVCLSSGVPSWTRRCGQTWPRGRDSAGDIRHEVVTEPGNSGGGVYDRAGRLVGIVTHYRACPANGQLCGGRATSLVGKRVSL